jgi:hypothetical protein
VNTARGISLHVGLNSVDDVHYQGWNGQLVACEADARDMQSIAQSLGYETTLLLTLDATRRDVRQAIESASRQLGKGDIFLLTYSGHGGQIPKETGQPGLNLYDSDATDQLDESWCLYDAQLLDDELNHSYRQFQDGVRILLIQDCCHSGFSDFDSPLPPGLDPDTGSDHRPEFMNNMKQKQAGVDLQTHREATPAVDGDFTSPLARSMPKSSIDRTYAMNRDFYQAIRDAIPKTIAPDTSPASILAMSACKENELAMDGTFNGAFTAAFLATWEQWAKDECTGDYDEFYVRLAKKLNKDSTTKQTPEMYSCAKDPVWISTIKSAKKVAWAARQPLQI